MKSRRFGFTVVEMLVVIAIIGVLAALLLPAVQAAREQARQIQCVSQMSQMGKAVAAYTTNRGELPPLRKQISTPTAQVYLGWPATLLMELGQGGLSDQLDLNVRSGSPDPASVFTAIPVLKCPTDISPNTASDDKFTLSYGANSGCKNDYTTVDSNGVGTLDYLGNGVFVGDATSFGSTKYRRPKFLLSDYHDGASNTILFGENADLDVWYKLSGTGFDVNTAETNERAGSILWFPQTTDPSTNSDPNSAGGGRSPLVGNADAGRSVVDFSGSNGWQFASPSSRHSSIIVYCFGDGSARKLSKNLDYSVYCLLMSSNGQKSFMPGYAASPTKMNWQATRQIPADLE